MGAVGIEQCSLSVSVNWFTHGSDALREHEERVYVIEYTLEKRHGQGIVPR